MIRIFRVVSELDIVGVAVRLIPKGKGLGLCIKCSSCVGFRSLIV